MPDNYGDVIRGDLRERIQFLLATGYTPEMIRTIQTPPIVDLPGSVLERELGAAVQSRDVLSDWDRQGYERNVSDRYLTYDPDQATRFRFVVRVGCQDPVTQETQYRFVVLESDIRPTRYDVENAARQTIEAKAGDPRYGRMPEVASQERACSTEVISATRNQ